MPNLQDIPDGSDEPMTAEHSKPADDGGPTAERRRNSRRRIAQRQRGGASSSGQTPSEKLAGVAQMSGGAAVAIPAGR